MSCITLSETHLHTPPGDANCAIQFASIGVRAGCDANLSFMPLMQLGSNTFWIWRSVSSASRRATTTR